MAIPWGKKLFLTLKMMIEGDGYKRAEYLKKQNMFAQFGEKVFGDSDSSTAWETWCHSIGMPTSLTELGVHPTDAQIEEMAEKCVFGRNGHVGFFQPLTKEDIAAILKMAK